MIREIINFTKNLNKDISILGSIKPQHDGVYILVNKNKECSVTYCFGSDEFTCTLKNCIEKIKYSWTIEYDKKPYYQKCFDLPNKRIHSISPYLVAFKRTYLSEGKEFKKDKKINKEYVLDYLRKSKSETLNAEDLTNVEFFHRFIDESFDDLLQKYLYDYEKEKKKQIKDDNYIIVLLDIDTEEYKKAFTNYLKVKIFNSSKLGITDERGISIKEKDFNKHEVMRGWSNFYNGYNAGKIFLKHMTGLSDTNHITNIDAQYLFDFKEYVRMELLPNPLPIFVDYEELKKDGIQSEIIKVWNDDKETKSYSSTLKSIFKKNTISLQKYYLLNIEKGNIVDFDFVPLFRYYISPNLIVKNICMAGVVKDKLFMAFRNDMIETVFDFEHIVVKSIFNNSLVIIKDDKYLTKYFGNIDPASVSGGDTMYLLILKYRKAIYDYIYKSKIKAINGLMFNDMMIQSILSNIHKDDVSGRFSWNNAIKEKLNIWFSLYNLFNNNNNNKQEDDMASKVTELVSKMSAVAKGESHFENPEEFAFGAGQIVSYLIDRSVASNKTYAMLEPYLQKSKSGQLQDAIAQTIALYKHDISTYKGAFQCLSSDVLTYDDNIEVKPLLKFFLAGCFCDCVIYQKKDSNNN